MVIPRLPITARGTGGSGGPQGERGKKIYVHVRKIQERSITQQPGESSSATFQWEPPEVAIWASSGSGSCSILQSILALLAPSIPAPAQCPALLLQPNTACPARKTKPHRKSPVSSEPALSAGLAGGQGAQHLPVQNPCCPRCLWSPGLGPDSPSLPGSQAEPSWAGLGWGRMEVAPRTRRDERIKSAPALCITPSD